MKRLLIGAGVVASAAVVAGSALVGTVAAANVPSAVTTVAQVIQEQQQGPSRVWLGLMLAVENNQLVVRGVTPNSPAATAGLQVGDIIVSVAGSAVNSPQAAQQAIANRSVGDTVAVVYRRGSGGNQTVNVTLAAPPARPNRPQITLPPVLQGLRDAAFAQRRNSTQSYVNAQGQTVTIESIPGVVQSVNASANQVVITRNDGIAQNVFTVNSATVIRAQQNNLSALQVGQQVVVVVDRSSPNTALAIHPARPERGGPGGPGGPGGRGGGPGGMAPGNR